MDRDNRFIDTAADMEEIVSCDNQHYHDQEVEMSITDDESHHSNQLNKVLNGAEQTMEYDTAVYDGYDVAVDNKIEDAADTESDNDRDMEEEDSLSVTEDLNLDKGSTENRCSNKRADVDKTNNRQESRESEETGEREGNRDINDADRFTNIVHPQEEHGRRSSRTPKPRVVYFAELPPVAHTNSSSHGHGHNNNNNHHNNNHRDSHASTRGNSGNNNCTSGISHNIGNQDVDLQTAEDGDEDLETSDGQSGLGCALPALRKFFTMRLEQVILYLGGTHVR